MRRRQRGNWISHELLSKVIKASRAGIGESHVLLSPYRRNARTDINYGYFRADINEEIISLIIDFIYLSISLLASFQCIIIIKPFNLRIIRIRLALFYKICAVFYAIYPIMESAQL